MSLRDDYANGVGFVDLALIERSAQLPPFAAEALGVALPSGADPVSGLGHALHACQLLMVLDNCEHLIAAAAKLVNALLSHTANVTFLVTSQEPLHIAQEQLFRVPALSVPVELSAADVRR